MLDKSLSGAARASFRNKSHPTPLKLDTGDALTHLFFRFLWKVSQNNSTSWKL